MARFTPIDMNTWPRREHFHSFARMAPTGYSLTAEVDVTCHHAATDGWHVKGFLEQVQQEADSFEERLIGL